MALAAPPAPMTRARARGGVALVSAMALAAAAFAQDAPAPQGGDPRDPAGPGTPVGVPGGPEVVPRPGPPVPPLPGSEVAPDVEPGPEIADPGIDADLDDALDPGLADGLDPVAEPDLGEAGEAIGGAADLDPEESPFADPLGLRGDADIGGVDPLLDRARDRGRRPRPALGRAAERGPGGLTLGFGLGLTLRAEDNPDLSVRDDDDGETTLAADLSFGALSQTRTQRLALDVETDVALGSNPQRDEDTLEVESPRLSFAYEREGARASFGAALSYSRIDLDEARLIDLGDLFDDLPDRDDLVISGGTRTDLEAEVEIVTGLGRPLGFELQLRADRRIYDGTDDPTLTDRDIDEAEGALRLDVTPLLTARLTFDASTLDDDSGETRDTRAYGVSAVYDATARATLTAALGTSEIDALRGVDLDDDGIDDALRRTETSGVEASVGIVYDMPRGTLSAEIESELEERGRRDTLRVARAFEPLEGVDLSASVGVSREEGADATLVADIAYAQELARGALTASLERRAGTSSDGDAVAATQASLGILQQVNRVSRISLDLDFAQVEGSGEGGGDESQSELRLAYIRDLTPDWSLSAGYELSRRGEGDEDATSNALFLTLGRDFLIRP